MQKYPKCKVCNSEVWKTNAMFCKKHGSLIVILKRSKRYRDTPEEEIFNLIRKNKYIVDKRFR